MELKVTLQKGWREAAALCLACWHVTCVLNTQSHSFSQEFGPLDKQVIDFEITPFLSLFLPCILFSLSIGENLLTSQGPLPPLVIPVRLDHPPTPQLSFSQHCVCIFIKAVIPLPRSKLFVFITQWTVVAVSQGLTLFCPKYPLPHRRLPWHTMTKCLIVTCQIQVTFQSLPYLKRLPAISWQMSVLLWEGSGTGPSRMCHPGVQNILSWNQWKPNKVRKSIFVCFTSLLKEIHSDRKTCFKKGTLAYSL